ncbi:heme biosynthesis protein HemY [Paenibacillus alba]|uniref:Tetratricopeptide repeat protein n=1 Tax=Paenibacillus alba TaxID=1197127 RepID=A0ABU6G1V6_9BACL|nr:hypothetical protein [Paenibacillus alba]MEC0227956.1 hypothetical protein [Paenibacillus alba]
MNKVISYKTIIGTVLTILGCYYFCLKFVYPGYFSPLIPYHADNFLYYSSAMEFHLSGDIFKHVRFVSTFIMSLFADFDFKIFNLCLIGIALGNLGLTLFFVRLITNKKINRLLIVFYLILVFTHPSFYTNYWFDIYNTFAYCFMILTLISWLLYTRHNYYMFKWIAFATIFLCFFSKETYIFSLLFFLAFQWVFGEKKHRTLLYLMMGYTLLIYGLVFYQSNFISNGPFINSTASQHDTYFISLNIFSVIKSYWFYVKLFANPFTLVVLSGVFIVNIATKTDWKNPFLLFVMGVLTYAPYSVLPNHLFEFYSWLAAPLSFSTILMISVKLDFIGKKIQTFGFFIIGIMIVFGIAWNTRAYDGQSSKWILNEESVNRHILSSFAFMQNQVAPGDRVLVTGVNSSFNPFLNLNFIDLSFNKKQKSYWTITINSQNDEKKTSHVSTLMLKDIQLINYDKVFIFDDQGFLTKFINRNEIELIPNSEENNLEMTNADLLLIPALNPESKKLLANPEDTDALMQVGIIYSQKRLFDKAQFYLEKALSIELKRTTTPNPYIYHYLGFIKEEEGENKEALAFYKEAVARMSNGQENFYFYEAVKRIEEKLK